MNQPEDNFAIVIPSFLPPDLATLLRRLDMEKYQSCFDDEEIDLQVLLHMNEGELDSIGIKRLGPRRKLMLAISGEPLSCSCSFGRYHN